MFYLQPLVNICYHKERKKILEIIIFKHPFSKSDVEFLEERRRSFLKKHYQTYNKSHSTFVVSGRNPLFLLDFVER